MTMIDMKIAICSEWGMGWGWKGVVRLGGQQ
jgi:hypothetical protein